MSTFMPSWMKGFSLCFFCVESMMVKLSFQTLAAWIRSDLFLSPQITGAKDTNLIQPLNKWSWCFTLSLNFFVGGGRQTFQFGCLTWFGFRVSIPHPLGLKLAPRREGAGCVSFVSQLQLHSWIFRLVQGWNRTSKPFLPQSSRSVLCQNRGDVV